MNRRMATLSIAVLGPVAGAIVTDIDAFEQAKRAWTQREIERSANLTDERAPEPKPQFDWSLFGARVARAAVVAIATGLGASLTLEG